MSSMKEKDEFSALFQSLGEAKMQVKEGFWEGLEKDLSAVMAQPADVVPAKRAVLRPIYRNLVAAASVLLIMAIGSIAFWSLDSREEQIQQAFSEVAANVEAPNLDEEVVDEIAPLYINKVSSPIASVMPAKPSVKPTGNLMPASLSEQVEEEDDDEQVSIQVTLQIIEQGYINNGGNVTGGLSNASNGNLVSDGESASTVTVEEKDSKWALKPAVGTSLPKGDYKMPVTAGLLVERKLNKRLAIETGLLYNYMPSDGSDNHSLALPVKLDVNLAEGKKVDLYATIGGMAEKLLGKSFEEEPVQLAATAGLGVRYKLSDNLAIYAEPSVSHHFDTDGKTRTLRTEQAVNLNLLCGVRMSY